MQTIYKNREKKDIVSHLRTFVNDTQPSSDTIRDRVRQVC